MTDDFPAFHFTDDRPLPNDSTLIVRISTGLNRKRRLLAEFARQLRLPNYFGWNWDAFEECLRDLTWLDGIRDVIILHRDLPFAASPENRATYLSILHDRLEWTHPRSPRIRIIFPTAFQSAVTRALGSCENP